MVDVNRPSRPLLTTSKILRLLSLILVGLSFVILHFFDIAQVGDSMQWKNGNTSVSAGSHPAVLIWAVCAVALFIVLMVRKPGAVTEGVPPRKRRVLAFLIDFWFSLSVVSSVGALIPLWLEARRTNHFVWHFQRDYPADTDGVAALLSLLSMALMVLYFAFPLTRGRQTIGYFIVGLKVAPPFGNDGSFTLKAALIRIYYAFIGLTSVLSRNWDRDGQGRTWYDRKTYSTVVTIADD
jgi:uncharacterized RDD family membrane protein YckC